MVGDDPLAQQFEREPSRGGGEPVKTLAERAQQPLVRGRELRRQALLDSGEQRSLARGAPDQHQRVVRDADERRGEHCQQRFVVVAVVEQAQVREEIDDLLLPEVATPSRPVRA